MPSPFPGMNPYLEQSTVWSDFHQCFLPVARALLLPQLLPRYFVKLDEHIYIHELGEEQGRFVGRADLGVAPARPGGEGAGAATLIAPARVLQPHLDVERVPYLEIRDRESRELVTALELLSPSNKYAGPDREQYLAKWGEILASRAHFVEIDLLRGGPRLPWRDLPACDYYAVVSRVAGRPEADVWHVRLRERLPIIPIPLLPGDAEARLDLQEVLHRVYDSAGYAVYIYDGQPSPPLSAEDLAWARSLIPSS